MTGWWLAAYSAGVFLLGAILGAAAGVLVLAFLGEWRLRRRGWRP